MNSILNTTQNIYRVYQLLYQNKTSNAITVAQQNLFQALNIFVGQSTTVGNTNFPVISLEKTINIKLLIYYYTKNVLFEEVYKRTSYIGKRRKQDGQYLLDEVALTKDDMSIFDPFMKDCFSEISDRLTAYTRQVNSAFLYFHISGIQSVQTKTYNLGDIVLSSSDVYELNIATENTDITNGFNTANWTKLEDYIYTDDKMEFVLMPSETFNWNVVPIVDSYIFEAFVNYIMYKWFILIMPELAQFYYGEFNRYLNDMFVKLGSTNKIPERRYRFL